jgi:hypothetical protein
MPEIAAPVCVRIGAAGKRVALEDRIAERIEAMGGDDRPIVILQMNDQSVE